MKNIFYCGLVFIAVCGHGTPSFAAKINCKTFSQEVDNYKSEASKKQKQLESLESQLQSGAKVINDYNKQCRAASSPNCNPAMFNMVSGQMNMMTGQKQKLQIEIIDAKTKQDEASKNLKMCKSVKLQKTVL